MELSSFTTPIMKLYICLPYVTNLWLPKGQKCHFLPMFLFVSKKNAIFLTSNFLKVDEYNDSIK